MPTPKTLAAKSSSPKTPVRDKRVDAYIAKAQDFAKPILIELRARMHAACPDLVENIKWGMPAFEYQGPFAGMASFKAHATFGFWKHSLLVIDDAKAKEAMGCYGRLTDVKQLPNKAEFARHVKTAMRLNEEGVKAPRTKTTKAPLAMHPDLKAALAKHAKAKAGYDALPPSGQREYLEWIGEAKRDETRAKRLADAIEWLAQGKSRHWKYQNC